MKNFIIDTNVLLQNPDAIFSFENNSIIIPIGVIEELDTFKRDPGELGRNSRQVSRTLDIFREAGDLRSGVEMEGGGTIRVIYNGNLGTYKKEKDVDYHVLHIAEVIKNNDPESETIVISRDVNVRLKANALGIKSQDYEAGKVCEKILDSGHIEVEPDKKSYAKLFLNDECESSEIFGEDEIPYPNYYIMVKPKAKKDKNILAKITKECDFLKKIDRIPEKVKIKPKNKEQAFAMDALLDPRIHLVSLVGMAGTGKAQPLSSKVLTPNGFKNMGDLKVGDEVLTPGNKVSKIKSIHPQGEKECFIARFSDGSSTECCMDHLWKTKTEGGNWKIRSLGEIKETIKENHEIPIVMGLDFNKNYETSISPYVFGLIIGAPKDLNNFETEVVGGNELKLGITNELSRLNLWGKSKNRLFIPDCYKYNTAEKRLELLRGIMDSKLNSKLEINISSRKLAGDIKFIVESLGGQSIIISNQSGYLVCIKLNEDTNPFKLRRLSEEYQKKNKKSKDVYRKLVDVISCGKKETQCIYIDDKEHLYITDDFIVTHNTLLATAAGQYLVEQVSEYEKMLISRPVQPTGKDIGYLPGTIEEKMDPWMSPIYDAIEIIYGGDLRNKKINGRQIVAQSGKILIEPLTYIRGRSIHNQFMIIDEAQNLTSLEIKTIITRAAENTKIVLTGDIDQIDNPYLDKRTNGLSVVLDAFRDSKYSAHIIMKEGVRSPLSEEATKRL